MTYNVFHGKKNYFIGEGREGQISDYFGKIIIFEFQNFLKFAKFQSVSESSISVSFGKERFAKILEFLYAEIFQILQNLWEKILKI